jgi:hypothetical protein
MQVKWSDIIRGFGASDNSNQQQAHSFVQRKSIRTLLLSLFFAPQWIVVRALPGAITTQ